uniref:ATP synthase F0 subunit 8 n=1 Tax=Allobathynella sp. JHS-2017 TaxID=2025385 RepID=A0A7R6D899_9CRUS|nr:ATP synthase F0 subunit 8 [Allobathynella sp. JHS-2017]
MPQMGPISWTMLFFMVNMTMLIFSLSLYFMTTMSKKKVSVSTDTLNYKLWSW